MARLRRDARLETREGRSRLKGRHEPYWRELYPGLALGYRKGKRGGVWKARRNLGAGRYQYTTLGTPNDHADADGRDVLDYKQAHAAALAWDADQNAPEDTEDPACTVSEALDRYFATFRGRWKAGAEKWANSRIRPDLGDWDVNDPNFTRAMREWLQRMADSPPQRRGRELPLDVDNPDAIRRRRATANRIRTILCAALNQAYHDGRARHPEHWRKVRPFQDVDEPRVRYLTEHECVRLVNASDAEFRPLVRAALLTGCRYSELTNLRVHDYNADARTVAVRLTKAGKLRHVPLTDEGVALFDELTAGRVGVECIFVKRDGSPWQRTDQTRRMREASKRAKLVPAVHFHLLRHAYGALLTRAGVQLKIVAEAMGHADTRMTERHYAHLQPDFIAETIRAHLPRFGVRKQAGKVKRIRR